MKSSDYFREVTRGLHEVPTIFHSSAMASDLEIRRYQKKKEILRQVFLARKRNRISAKALEEYLNAHITGSNPLNIELFTELFNDSDLDSKGFISM